MSDTTTPTPLEFQGGTVNETLHGTACSIEQYSGDVALKLTAPQVTLTDDDVMVRAPHGGTPQTLDLNRMSIGQAGFSEADVTFKGKELDNNSDRPRRRACPYQSSPWCRHRCRSAGHCVLYQQLKRCIVGERGG
jgi:hypothetical protein